MIKLRLFILAIVSLCLGCGRDGEVRTYHKSGKLFEIKNFKKGKLHGSYVSFFENGNKFEESCFIDGEFEGRAIVFSEAGDTILVQEYRHGKKHGSSRDFFPGNLRRGVTSWVDGHEEGKEVTYHQNGTIATDGKYCLGVKDGEWLFFDDKGRLIKTEFWKVGKLLRSYNK